LKRLLFKLTAFALFVVPSTGHADWGEEPAYVELSRYSKISMGFASQDLKTPISYFGHTFLVFHNFDPPEADSLAVEFTGDAPDFLANIAAFFKSVPGKYSLIYLSEKLREYDLEDRSIWLFKLNLSGGEIESIKQYIFHNRKTKFPYDFSQRNCAYYIAQTITQSNNALKYKRDGVFITPVSTLRDYRADGIISSEIYMPSTQIKALNDYEGLSGKDQKVTVNYINDQIIPKPQFTNLPVSNALSSISEYLIPREENPSKRNYLFSIKRKFPSSSSLRNKTEVDPSLSAGPNSISALLLLNKSGLILSFSPWLIGLENEASSGQKNSNIEVLSTDLFVKNISDVRLEQFHLVRIESNQPGGYLRDGFTQTLDISYTNYHTYFDSDYREAQILFGRGISWLQGGHTISLLPLVSVVDSWQDNKNNVKGRVQIRLKDYKKFIQNITFAAQIDQTINPASEIRQIMNLELIRSIRMKYSISFNLHRVKGRQQASNLVGLRLSASF
jgi:hypothetical protein